MFNHKYDLEERTLRFAEQTIDFIKTIPKGITSTPLLSQLIRSATSVGANYCEANCAETRKDFEHKLGICKKEVSESKYWLRLISKAHPEYIDQARILWKEANELQLIFITIVKNSKNNATNH